ncbi:MAG: hypothetical protein ACRCTY_05290, partial [Candidatus Adiutrix sp.]
MDKPNLNPLTNHHELSTLDRRIINRIQKNFPIAPRPYEVLAHDLNE